MVVVVVVVRTVVKAELLHTTIFKNINKSIPHGKMRLHYSFASQPCRILHLVSSLPAMKGLERPPFDGLSWKRVHDEGPCCWCI